MSNKDNGGLKHPKRPKKDLKKAKSGEDGPEKLNKKKIEEVNVEGTKNVIKACRSLSIPRLVYTSTYNVVFGGQKIENGDESLPYLPLEKHPDWYSRTKAVAELEVLGASGSSLAGSGKLCTCALRLAGIYGPGEQRHFPRIVSYVERGYFCLLYGERDSLVDFVHVDNVVQAHVKAAQSLAKDKSPSDGQPYFISDCKPINNFEFFRPLVEGLGYKFPTIVLPLSIVYFTAIIIEMIHSVVGHVYNFQPLLCRTEVYKTGVTHYFNNGRAIRELGYKPTVQNDIGPVVQWFLDRGHGRKQQPPSSLKTTLVNFILAAVFVVVLLSFIPYVK